MIFARPYVFDRRLGQGINVFNPGDRLTKPAVQTNLMLRNHLNALLRDSNRVKYVHSRYANSNNGIYALMDVKGNNRKRFAGLHGIISEGVHKVDKIEETVNSLFLALMNPEDRPGIEEIQSFSDRITVIKIPYVLDYNTEVRIYKNIFGEQVESRFLPRVLPNFAKVIISTRLKQISDGLQEWIPDTGKYRLYCDEYLQLLKMEIYAGFIPKWLTQEDRARFTAKRRKTIIAESELEGERGFSGRDSIKIFGEFISTFAKNEKLINMGMLCSYFGEIRRDLGQALPSGFLGSLVHSYNYTVLQEVKESLYNYNEERISRDIQNYLFASNFEPGSVERCVYTGELLEITPGWFENMEQRFLGADAAESYRAAFRDEVQNRFATQVLTQEMMVEGKAVTDTSSFHSLRERYVHTLKEKALDPFRGNDTFRSAIKDYGTEPFKAYDGRTQEEVESLIRNLAARYGYSAKGAQEVCIYVIDNDLAQTYTSL
jgi:predicted Ser/Thr protein kinase